MYEKCINPYLTMIFKCIHSHFSYDMSKCVIANPKPDLPRKRITISIDESLIDWADEVVNEGFKFKDRSHVFERAIYLLKESEKTK